MPIQVNKYAGLTAGATGKLNYFRDGMAIAKLLNMLSDYGGAMEVGYNSEEVTLSTGGATTDTAAGFLPAGSFLLGVTSRVTETFGTAASYTLGDATTAARFLASNSDVTAGDEAVGIAHLEGGATTDAAGPTQASAAALRITANTTPSAGKLLIQAWYVRFTPAQETPA